jgi:hypothetical protein
MSEPKTEVHVSRFEVMRRLVGELDGDRAAALDEHVTKCSTCASLLGELRDVQAAGMRDAPPLDLPAVVVHGPWRKAAPYIAMAAAAAIAAFAVYVPPTGVRAKGTVIVSAHCVAPGEDTARPCATGDALRPNSAVVFLAELREPRFMMLLGRDRSRAWTTHFPAGEDTAREIAPDMRDFVGHSFVLDATPGEEVFVVFHSRNRFSRRDLERALANDASSDLPRDVEATVIRFEKDLGGH